MLLTIFHASWDPFWHVIGHPLGAVGIHAQNGHMYTSRTLKYRGFSWVGPWQYQGGDWVGIPLGPVLAIPCTPLGPVH